MMQLGEAGRIVAVAVAAVAAAAGCDRDEERVPATAREAADDRVAPEPGFGAVTRELLDAGRHAARDWPVHGGAYPNQRYSALDRINRENVAALAPVWVYQTGVSESFQTTPLVHENAMYLTTAESHVIALNAATGEKLWEYIPALETTSLCCGPNNRGVAAYGEKVYVGTLDAHLVALDNRTGEVAWREEIADSEEGYSITMAPLAYAGKVFVGVSGGEYGIRGFVEAYDAETGERAWRFHTIPSPDEAPNGWWGEWKQTTPFGTPTHRDIFEEREDSAEHATAWRDGGGGVWMTPAYDPGSGLLYLVVGNPSPDLAGSVRPGDNLYTGSVLALKGETGELEWAFQYLPHDRWNLGGGSAPFLFDLNGRRYVGHAGKTGWLYIVDARNGRPVLRSENFVPQENLFAPPTAEGTRMAPGANGGSGTAALAYSPRARLAFVPAVHEPMVFTRQFTPRQDGVPWLGGSFTRLPDGERWGVVSAIDVETGKIRWQRRTPAAPGSALATAGDVVFVGQGSGTFDAFDAETGDLLWQFPTGAGVHGGPITYTIHDVQYVAVAAGGNYHLDTPRGDDLYVFALQGQHPPAPRGSYTRANYRRTEPQRYGAVRQVPASEVRESVRASSAEPGGR